jgi:signal peptidase
MKVWIKAVLIFAIIIVTIHVSAYTATGTWQMGFAMVSMSMEPNMLVGDIILVQSSQRTSIITYEDGKIRNYRSFNDYGDVIIYHPNGMTSGRIMHRAMYWVDKGAEMPDGKPAPNAGYITKGDNNLYHDQDTRAFGYEPVRPEGVIAVPKARIPYLGYLKIFLGIWFSFIIYAMIYAIIVGYLMRKKKRQIISR